MRQWRVIACLVVTTWSLGYAVESALDRVKLSEVKALTFTYGSRTTGRRSDPIDQLQCVGGVSGLCDQYHPTSVLCQAVGHDGTDIVWRCEDPSMPTTFVWGPLTVSCEGYESPDDPSVLDGSCALQYELGLNPNVESDVRPPGHGMVIYVIAIILVSAFLIRPVPAEYRHYHTQDRVHLAEANHLPSGPGHVPQSPVPTPTAAVPNSPTDRAMIYSASATTTMPADTTLQTLDTRRVPSRPSSRHASPQPSPPFSPQPSPRSPRPPPSTPYDAPAAVYTSPRPPPTVPFTAPESLQTDHQARSVKDGPGFWTGAATGAAVGYLASEVLHSTTRSITRSIPARVAKTVVKTAAKKAVKVAVKAAASAVKTGAKAGAQVAGRAAKATLVNTATAATSTVKLAAQSAKSAAQTVARAVGFAKT